MKRALPDHIQDLYPLTPTQQGMLFHSIAEPNHGVYIIQVSFTLRGKLDQKILSEAWQELIQRHDVLRTAFVWEKVETPMQVVGKKATFPFEHHYWEEDYREAGSPADLSEWPQYQDWLKEDRERDFALSKAPLMRFGLFSLGDEHSHLVWTYHHLILDGWSLPILLGEWMLIYRGLKQKKNPQDLLPPAPHFKDYVQWLHRKDGDASRLYWKEYLSGLTEATSLGLPEREAGKGSAKQILTLDSSLTASFKTLAQQERLTLSTLVQGAWAILLSRYGDQDDVLFGLARSGRPAMLADVERCVGLFINTAPLRVSLPPRATTFDWLRDIQTEQQAQQEHETLPLVEIHALSDFPRNEGLFDTVVVFENYPQEYSSADEASLNLSEVSLQEQTNYSLSLYVIADDELEFRLLYPPGRFEAQEITQVLEDLSEILRGFTHSEASNQHPSTHFPEPQPPSSFNGPLPDLTNYTPVIQAFNGQVQQAPDKTALIFKEQKFTYRELDQKATQLAATLQKQKIGANSTVAILLPRSTEMIVALLATFKTGAHYLPLDPSHPSSRLQLILEDAQPDLILHDHSTEPLFPPHPRSLNLSTISFEKEELFRAPDYSLSSLAYLIYTSGTTGRPKGVTVSQLNLANLLCSFQALFSYQSERSWLAVTTLAFDISALEIFLPLKTGATVILASDEEVQNGEQLVTLLKTHHIDTLQATPSGWQIILPHWHSPAADFTALCGGEPLGLNLAHELLATRAQVWNVYGPTETTIWSGALRLESGHLAEGIVPVGGPLDHTGFHLLDSKLRPSPLGTSGELALSGVGLSPGYHQQAKLTAERFITRSIHGETKRLYLTGDRVRARADGTLQFLGRMDHQIKLRGYRIELGEIETALHAHPEVEQAIVVLQKEDTPEARLLAALITSLNPGSEEGRKTLQEHLAERLPPYMLPGRFTALAEFPLTPNGKIDRKALALLETSLTRPSQAPSRTEIEQKLAKIWARLLDIESPGLYDNFFDIGGHSLLVLKARSEIKEAFGVELPLAEFFRHPTLHSLANHLAQSDNQKAPRGDRKGALAVGKSRLQQRRERQKTRPNQTS